MLTEAFTLIIQLPPLAFGPAWPPPAFAPPRALVSPLPELGRLHEPVRPPRLVTRNATLDPRFLTPTPERYLVNRPVDILLLLATAYAGRATWDGTPWSARTWQATGAVTPALIPPLAPPAWSTSLP
jgi:hypothetical protein